MVVSRETFLGFSKVLKLIESRVLSSFGEINDSSCFEGVSRGLLPFLTLLYSKQNKKPFVIVCNDYSIRMSLFESLSSFLDKKCFNFTPSSSVEGISSADLHVLSSFKKLSGSIVLVSDSSFKVLCSFLADSSSVEQSVSLSSLQTRGSLISILEKWRLDVSEKVFSPGFYSIRGSIIDFFLFGENLPIRVEFDGNIISSVRSFDIETQNQIEIINPDNIILSPPPYLSKKTIIIKNFFFKTLSIVQTSNDIFSIKPLSERATFCYDLSCINHSSFKKNFNLLNSVLSLKKAAGINTFFLFLNRMYSKNLNKISSLVPFSLSDVSLSNSFSSVPLGLFFLNFSDVYDIEQVSKINTTHHKRKISSSVSVFSWKSLVVHEDMGVGIYKGLSKIKSGSSVVECITLEYKHGDKVHVPLENLHSLDKYIGSKKTENITDLRKTLWQRDKIKAKKSAGEIVESFIEMYGKRTYNAGFAFEKDGVLYEDLKSSFKYIETEDQNLAYKEIKSDMEKSVPMDRLLCGDVGFGKTEVAIRSTLKALNSNKQVVILAPTTILSNQLFIAFNDRLKKFGFTLCQLSRFISKKNISKYINNISNKSIDVIIGTHRVLSKDVKIPNLGLIIIDEEHRFGANHKEKLRVLSNNVDVISMSATPIPRTMQFALMGIRDISTIKTPPLGRLPIITNQLNFDSLSVKHAALYEKERGGQSFFVFNNIKKIESMVIKLKTILPSLKIKHAHGKMKPKDLEKIMNDMFLGKIDLLVCTTIIEAGVDLQNVNTIFVYDSQNYGLSQLYQMRGRVGRSSIQAYCYLLTPSVELSSGAIERLRTLQYNTGLGSGYNIAVRDFEIRGGGNLFGVEQSGHLSNVGLNFFNKMIKEKAFLLNVKKSVDFQEKGGVFNISINGEALIPDNYMSNQEDRLFFYRKLSICDSVLEVDRVEKEIRDRFGVLPVSISLLLLVRKIRLLSVGSSLSFLKVEEVGSSMFFKLKDNKKILNLVKNTSVFFNNSKINFSVKHDSNVLVFNINISNMVKSMVIVVDVLKFLKDESS